MKFWQKSFVINNKGFYSLQNEINEMVLEKATIKKLLNKIWYILPSPNETNNYYYIHTNDIIKLGEVMFLVKEIHLITQTNKSIQTDTVNNINSLNEHSNPLFRSTSINILSIK